jgi:hypothetical protein
MREAIEIPANRRGKGLSKDLNGEGKRLLVGICQSLGHAEERNQRHKIGSDSNLLSLDAHEKKMKMY